MILSISKLQLFYDLLETAVYDVFPELAESNAAMKFKKFTVWNSAGTITQNQESLIMITFHSFKGNHEDSNRLLLGIDYS